jgi:hypothetical protein
MRLRQSNRKQIIKNYKTQFLINTMLTDEIEKKKFQLEKIPKKKLELIRVNLLNPRDLGHKIDINSYKENNKKL